MLYVSHTIQLIVREIQVWNDESDGVSDVILGGNVSPNNENDVNFRQNFRHPRHPINKVGIYVSFTLSSLSF